MDEESLLENACIHGVQRWRMRRLHPMNKGCFPGLKVVLSVVHRVGDGPYCLSLLVSPREHPVPKMLEFGYTRNMARFFRQMFVPRNTRAHGASIQNSNLGPFQESTSMTEQSTETALRARVLHGEGSVNVQYERGLRPLLASKPQRNGSIVASASTDGQARVPRQGNVPTVGVARNTGGHKLQTGPIPGMEHLCSWSRLRMGIEQPVQTLHSRTQRIH